MTAFSASESGIVQKDGTVVSEIGFSFSYPVPLKSWKREQIWVAGYLGSSSPRLLTIIDGANTATIAMQTTQETVTFYAVSENIDGLIATILTSPSYSLTLNGQISAPNAPTNFAGQTNTGTAGQVLLTWDPNTTDKDIKSFELVRSANNTAPISTDPTFTIQAVYNALRKHRYVDTPGPGAVYFYVRAVNTSGLRSSFTGPASVTALAPDGTTDIDVPDANYSYAALTIPAPVFGAGMDGTVDLIVQSGLTVLYKSSTFPATNPPLNVAGVKVFNIKLTYTGGDGLGDKTFHFADDATVTAAKRVFQCELPNATITDIETWMTNYFGDGVHRAFHLSGTIVLGSKAQDIKMTSATAFNPTTQQIGANRIEGHTGTNRITTNGAGHWEMDKDLDMISNARFLIAGSAGTTGALLQRTASGMLWSTAVLIDPNSGNDRLLVGLPIPSPGTGLSTLFGSIIAADVIAAIDGAAGGTMTDASIVSIASSPGIGASPGGCDWSSGKIGTGIVLPARVYIFHTEVMRFDPQSTTSGAASRMLLGLTSTDVSSNFGSIVSVDAICCVDAASNAGLMSMGVAGGAGNLTVYKTGSGTALPLKIFTGHALSVTVDVSHNMTIVGTLTVQGSGATIGGDVIASGVYHSQTWAGNNAGIFINDTLGNPHLVVGGLVT